jgi:integrase
MRYEKIKNAVGVRLDTKTGKYNASKKVNGKSYSRNFKTLREAKHWRNNFHPTICPNPKQSNPYKKASTKANGSDVFITLSEVYEKYNSLYVVTLSPAYQQRKKYCLDNFLYEIMNLKLCDLNPEVLAIHLNKKIEIAKKDKNSQRYNFDRDLKELSAMLNWYNDFIDDSFRNPVKKYHKELGRFKELPDTDRKITPEDFLKFINSFTEKQELYKDIAMIQYFTACRINEVAAISPENIDLENRVLLINRGMLWVKGQYPKTKKGVKTGRSASDEKRVFINDTMFEILNRRLAVTPKDLDVIFHNHGKYLRYNAIYNNYVKALKAADVPFTGTHILRHGMATTTRKMLGIEHAQSVTGHKTRRQLEEYADSDLSSLNKEAVQEVERFLNRRKSHAKKLFKAVQTDF